MTAASSAQMSQGPSAETCRNGSSSVNHQDDVDTDLKGNSSGAGVGGIPARPDSGMSDASSSPEEKSEINDAVTKVLRGYDWTLVPMANK